MQKVFPHVFSNKKETNWKSLLWFFSNVHDLGLHCVFFHWNAFYCNLYYVFSNGWTQFIMFSPLSAHFGAYCTMFSPLEAHIQGDCVTFSSLENTRKVLHCFCFHIGLYFIMFSPMVAQIQGRLHEISPLEAHRKLLHHIFSTKRTLKSQRIVSSPVEPC